MHFAVATADVRMRHSAWCVFLIVFSSFKYDAFVKLRCVCVSAPALVQFVSRCIHLYNLVSQIHDALRVKRQHMDLSL